MLRSLALVEPTAELDRDSAKLCFGVEVPAGRHRPSIDAIRTYDAGESILLEGDPAEELMEIVKGFVRIYKLLADGRRQIVGFLFPKSFLGRSLNDRYIYSAEAATIVQVRAYPRSNIEYLLREVPDLARRFLAMASDELYAAQDQMLLLGRKSAEEKLATFLLMMADRTDIGDRTGDYVELPMRRLDIADYLGLTIETVCRTLSRLRQEGVIELPSPSRVVFLQRDKLLELAESDFEEE